MARKEVLTPRQARFSWAGQINYRHSAILLGRPEYSRQYRGGRHRLGRSDLRCASVRHVDARRTPRHHARAVHGDRTLDPGNARLRSVREIPSVGCGQPSQFHGQIHLAQAARPIGLRTETHRQCHTRRNLSSARIPSPNDLFARRGRKSRPAQRPRIARHTRWRLCARRHRRPGERRISAYFPCAYAIRGERNDVPGSILARSHVIEMRRGKPSKKFRSNDPAFVAVREAIAKWRVVARFELDPELPAVLSNPRNPGLEDNCLPLIAVADLFEGKRRNRTCSFDRVLRRSALAGFRHPDVGGYPRSAVRAHLG